MHVDAWITGKGALVVLVGGQNTHKHNKNDS